MIDQDAGCKAAQQNSFHQCQGRCGGETFFIGERFVALTAEQPHKNDAEEKRQQNAGEQNDLSVTVAVVPEQRHGRRDQQCQLPDVAAVRRQAEGGA